MKFEDLPIEIQEQIKKEEIIFKDYKNKYYSLHSVCPKCKERNFISTLMAFPIYLDRLTEYQDLNDVKCNCGWDGTIHELISENNND